MPWHVAFLQKNANEVKKHSVSAVIVNEGRYEL